MTPEAKIKQRIKQILEELGCYYFMPIGGPYSRIGVPDFIGCIDGLYIAIEAKAGKNKATALQLRELEKVRQCGGLALVVDDSNIDSLKAQIDEWRRREWVVQ